MKLIDADELKVVSVGRKNGRKFVHADITDAPTIDAIPVEWLVEQRNRVAHLPRNGKSLTRLIDGLIAMWQKEQEAR